MKIAVIGASGRLGSAVAREAASRGHEVTAVSRDTSRLGAVGVDTLPGVATAVADLTDPLSIARAVIAHDAVVVSVKGDEDGRRRIIADAARTLLDVLPDAKVGRLVFLGGGASLRLPTGQRLMDTPAFPAEFQDEAQDQAEALEVLQSADTLVDWSYVSPSVVFLADGADTGTHHSVPGDALIMDPVGEAQVTTGDYAAAILGALESGAFIRERFTVGS